MFDVGGLQKQLFEPEGNRPFHLTRPHSLIECGDGDDRKIDLREDIDLHFLKGHDAENHHDEADGDDGVRILDRSANQHRVSAMNRDRFHVSQ
jgi:hypothetical protein